MSFLGDIVNSIGGDKVPAPPKPPNRPTSANSGRPVLEQNKIGPKVAQLINPSPLNGIKRKAEDVPNKASEKLARPNPTPGLTSSVQRRPAAPPLNAPKPQVDKPYTATKIASDKPVIANTGQIRPNVSTNVAPPATAASSTTPSGPAPTKGSYADIMARAKQAAELKAKSQVGVIKHQTTVKEKHSKVVDRNREEPERAKSQKSSLQGVRSGRIEKRRSVSPVKKEKIVEPKGARPSLSAPASKYKGTMGTSSARAADKRDQAKKAKRYDEYLGTDEEDDSDVVYDYDDEDDYGSEGSSDMEAGAFDIDMEEQQALRRAREDDAKELEMENRLKREKEERRRKIEGLVAKKK